jgi:hypothetical protein
VTENCCCGRKHSLPNLSLLDPNLFWETEENNEGQSSHSASQTIFKPSPSRKKAETLPLNATLPFIRCMFIWTKHTPPSSSEVKERILINDQLDAQFPYIFISIFCMFLATCAHRQESQLYQYNIWYMSLCVGDRPVCRSGISYPTRIPDGHLYRVTYTRCCGDTSDSPDDEHKVARNM